MMEEGSMIDAGRLIGKEMLTLFSLPKRLIPLSGNIQNYYL